jgi:hypothetical protein
MKVTSRRLALASAGLLSVLGLLAVLTGQRQEAAPAAAEPAASTAFPWAGASAVLPVVPVASTPEATATAAVAAAPAPAGTAAFRADAQGQLVLDTALRLRAEQLLALHEGTDLAARLDAELAGLPPAAAVRARELLTRIEGYQAAQRAAFPPGEAPLVPEEGLAQLNAMQALRVSHLGAEAARQLYGEDDAVARRLLELMRDETDTSLNMEQKAMRAQARYDLERGAVRR